MNLSHLKQDSIKIYENICKFKYDFPFLSVPTWPVYAVDDLETFLVSV